MLPILAGLAIVGAGAYAFKKYQEYQLSSQEEPLNTVNDSTLKIKPIDVKLLLNGEIENTFSDIAFTETIFLYSQDHNALIRHYHAAFKKLYEVLSTLEQPLTINAKELENYFEINVSTDSEEAASMAMIKLLELNLYFTEQLTKQTNDLFEDFEGMHKEFLETFGKLANK